jgi:DNA-directed RNA polymerase specialized sigma24 family protein
LSESSAVDPDIFYRELREEGVGIRDILWPLSTLSPRERAVFVEYHYWDTHMKIVAESHRISLGRAYVILYRAEKKIASSRSQKEEENT